MVVAPAADGAASPVRYQPFKSSKSNWARGLLLVACLVVSAGILERCKLQLSAAGTGTQLHAAPCPAAAAAAAAMDTAAPAAGVSGPRVLAAEPGALQQLRAPQQAELQQLLAEVKAISTTVHTDVQAMSSTLHEVNAAVRAAAAGGAARAAATARDMHMQAQALRAAQQVRTQQVLPYGLRVHYKAQARSACSRMGGYGLRLPASNSLVAPVVIMAYNRVHYLARTMATLLKHWSEDEENAIRFPLFVSIDDGNDASTLFAAAFSFSANVQVIHNVRDTGRCRTGQGYCNLSVHYQMLMQLFFECLGAPRLILLEEDLDIAPDFFPYFARLAPVMDSDPSILCISAWNDHGQYGRASNATALYRTDIFPGLGWMTTAAIGRELLPAWPDIYWMDWLRQAATRKGRQCVFPEVSRTHTFGRMGTSNGQFYERHLRPMLLNKEKIDWANKDVGYLKKEPYAELMAGWLESAEPISRDSVIQYCIAGLGDADSDKLHTDLVTRYRDEKDFLWLATHLPPMLSDVRGGVKGVAPNVPRMGYEGVVVVRCRGRRLFIAPEPDAPGALAASNAPDAFAASNAPGAFAAPKAPGVFAASKAPDSLGASKAPDAFATPKAPATYRRQQ